MKLIKLFIILLFVGGLPKQMEAISKNSDVQWELFENNGNYGAKNHKGKILVPAKYSYVNWDDGYFTVKDRSGYIGKYDSSGHVIFPPYRYNQVYVVPAWKDSPFIVVSDRWGVINRKGKLIIKDEYISVKPFGDDESGCFFILQKNGFQGVANINGDIIISPDKYNEVGYFKLPDNKVYFAFFKYGEGSGVCDDKGNVVINTKYLTTIPKGDKNSIYFEVSDGKNVGKLNKNGKIISPINTIKTDIGQFVNIVNIDNRELSLYIDDQNKFFLKNNSGDIISSKYDMMSQCKDKFIIYDKEYIGLMSASGEEIISPKQGFISLHEAEGYYLAIDKKDNTAIISFDGDVLFQPIHKSVQMHKLKTNQGEEILFKYRDEIGAFGVKDVNYNIIIPPIYDNLSYSTFQGELYFNVYKDDFCGLLAKDGSQLFDSEYHDIDIKLHKGRKYYLLDTGYKGIADENGSIIINPETFDNILFAENQLIAISGKRICKFSLEGKLLSDNINRVRVDEFTNQADEFFEAKNYKKAAEFYGKAIDISPSASLYFNRGVSYYNNNKYNDAIADFNQTLRLKPSERLRVRSIELIERAEHYQQEKEYRQQQLASAIFGLALTGVNMALQSSSTKSKTNYNQQSTYSNSSGKSDSQSSQNSYSNYTSDSKKKQKCGFCGGKGSIIDYTASFDNPDKWCDECGKTVVAGHYHKTCSKCHGAGEY